MAERRTIGQILLDLGRVTESEVARALEHQQRNGGYFGEALVALGIVTQEELEWSLASQFDIPYVFPEADSIDLEAAALVTPDWALANLTLPIMKTAESMTVIVDSPIRSAAVDDLEKTSELPIELALASPGKIRELIRQVYARVEASQEKQANQVLSDLTGFVAAAVDQGAAQFGVSLRGHRAIGWYESPTEVRRHLLTSTWEEELATLLVPRLTEHAARDSMGAWSGHLESKGVSYPISIRRMTSPSGREILFRRVEDDDLIHQKFPPPPAAILSEVGLLVRSGPVRFALTTSPSETALDLLSHLPLLLLDPTWRTIHLRSVELSTNDLFVSVVPSGQTDRERSLEELRDFRFDVVTAQLKEPLGEWIEDVLDVGRVTFVSCSSDDDRRAAENAGVTWELQARFDGANMAEWSLAPLRSSIRDG